MKNIQPLKLDKFNDTGRYVLLENGIYKDLQDTDMFNCRSAISFELEDGEDSQYPLEDILEEFMLYVAEFYESENPERLYNIELAGTLEDLRTANSALIGKRAFNREVVGEDGQTYVKLIIE